MDEHNKHEIELYPPDVFKTLLEHEVNRSRRYGDSLTLIDLVIETEPVTEDAQHSAEVFTINALNVYLRDTDIPCKKDNEFLILMPSTSAPGARTACERLRKLMSIDHQSYDRVSFNLSAFIGMATMPIDHSISSEELAGYAAQALQHARANRSTGVVSYPELKK